MAVGTVDAMFKASTGSYREGGPVNEYRGMLLNFARVGG